MLQDYIANILDRNRGKMDTPNTEMI